MDNMKLTEADKAKLADMQEIGEVLKVLVRTVTRLHLEEAPAIAWALREATAPGLVSGPARVLLWELADGIDLETGRATDRS